MAGKCSMEEHLWLCVRLMLFFFLLDYTAEVLLAFKVTTIKIGGAVAHDAYIAFFGLAMGIFRGMLPTSPAPGVTATQTVTTEVKETHEVSKEPVV